MGFHQSRQVVDEILKKIGFSRENSKHTHGDFKAIAQGCKKLKSDDSPFDLEAYSDSDYDGASLDRKSTIGGCQFLGSRLISWQCKKQTIVANSTTKAEYVFAASCYGQKAQQLELKLYVGDIIKKNNPIVIPDSEETLMLAEESHSKMLLKQKDPIIVSTLRLRLLNKKDFIEKEIYNKLFKSFTTLKKHCISLEVDNQHQRDNYVSNQSAPSFDQSFKLNELKAQSQEKDAVINMLKERINSLSEKMNEDKIKKDLEEIETINIKLDHMSVEISDLNASLQEKVLVITALKDDLRNLKGKALVDNDVTKHPSDPEMLKIDEEATVLRDLVEHAKSKYPLDQSLEYAYSGCDPKDQGVKPSTSASGSQPSGNTKKYKIQQIPSSTQKNKVEAHPRKVKSSLKNKDCVVQPKGTTHVKHSKLNANSELKCFPMFHLPTHEECNVVQPKCSLGIRTLGWGNGGAAAPTYDRRDRLKLTRFRSIEIFWDTKSDSEMVTWKKYWDLAITILGIIRYQGKTPYELLHDKLPDLSFFHVFGALYYPTNDSENLGKLQPKANIGIFIDYAPINKAFRIYNRCTKGIIETIHVDFDKLTAMASEHSSSGPALHEMTPTIISSGLVPNHSPSTQYVPPSRTDCDILFQPLFDELLTPLSSVDHPAPEVIAPINEVVALVPAVSISSPTSTTVDQDTPSPSNSQTTPETQSPIIPNDVKEDNHGLDVAHMNNDLFFGIPILENDSEASSSSDVIPTIVHTATPNSEHVNKWTKNHPLDNIIVNYERTYFHMTPKSITSLMVYYDPFLTQFEQRTIKTHLTQA
ncbi:retrovirus-related pol polyprotein from transposon TNT 1-94 [Tanacetum coccineum]